MFIKFPFHLKWSETRYTKLTIPNSVFFLCVCVCVLLWISQPSSRRSSIFPASGSDTSSFKLLPLERKRGSNGVQSGHAQSSSPNCAMQGYSCTKGGTRQQGLDSGPRRRSQHDLKKLLCHMLGFSQDWLLSNFIVNQCESSFYHALPIKPALQPKNRFDVQLFRRSDSVPGFWGLASKRRTTPKRSDFKAVNLPIWGILWQFNIGSCHSYGKLPIYKWYIYI